MNLLGEVGIRDILRERNTPHSEVMIVKEKSGCKKIKKKKKAKNAKFTQEEKGMILK